MNKTLESRIHDLLISKSNASAFSYFCDYDKKNDCLVILSKDKELFTISLANKTIREVFTDVYYMITSADIAPKLIDEIELLQRCNEDLQKENKRLKELNGIMSAEIL